MTTTPNFDILAERLRERIAESTGYGAGTCWNCDSTLTQIDIERGDCSQCGQGADSGDGSADEDLWPDDEDCCGFDD